MLDKNELKDLKAIAFELVSSLREPASSTDPKSKAKADCYLRAAYFDAVSSLDKLNKAIEFVK